MINYIDKLRIAATLMVFSLHSLLFTGKKLSYARYIKRFGGGTLYFLLLRGVQFGYFL